MIRRKLLRRTVLFLEPSCSVASEIHIRKQLAFEVRPARPVIVRLSAHHAESGTVPHIHSPRRSKKPSYNSKLRKAVSGRFLGQPTNSSDDLIRFSGVCKLSLVHPFRHGSFSGATDGGPHQMLAPGLAHCRRLQVWFVGSDDIAQVISGNVLDVLERLMGEPQGPRRGDLRETRRDAPDWALDFITVFCLIASGEGDQPAADRFLAWCEKAASDGISLVLICRV